MPKKPRDQKNKLLLPLLDDEPVASVNPSELEDELRDLLGASGALEDEDCDEEPDENDPRLLAELQEFISGDEPAPKKPVSEEPVVKPEAPSPSTSGVSIEEVTTRITGYRSAIESLKTVQPIDTTRIRRYERVLKQLDTIATRISNGQTVNADELPAPAPPVAPRSSEGPMPTVSPVSHPAGPSIENQGKQSSSQHSEPLPGPSSSSTPIDALKRRCQDYKRAALKARNDGQIAEAKKLLGAVKFIESMLPKIESGEESFDPESDMPPTPEEFLAMPGDEAEDNSSSPAPQATSTRQTEFPPAMTSPTVTAENLQLRLTYFKNQVEELKANPAEASKMRRYMRITTQYEHALRAFEHGITSYAYNELPPPPNCHMLSKPTTLPRTAQEGSTPTSHASQGSASLSKNERMVALLKTRQTELRAAALKAKEAGNMELARTHLRAALSVNPLLASAEAGIPFDLSTLPAAPKPMPSTPNLSRPSPAFTGAILSGTACEPTEVLRLELESLTNQEERNKWILNLLEKQTKEASEYALQFEHAGLHDIAAKMTELAKVGHSSVRYFRSRMLSGASPPYGFESANIPQLNMNPDLGDDMVEVTVVRGFSYPLPSEISSAEKLDTQVELVFPAQLNDNPQKHYTSWQKHTTDPTYDSVARFQVDTRSRSFQLVIKRKLKATVYYSRGLLRSSRVLGTAQFSLEDLATSATVNQSASLMDGRKAVGGGLLLRLRQRSCGSGPRVTAMEKPWLVLQPTKRSSGPTTQSRSSPITGDRHSPSLHGSTLSQERPQSDSERQATSDAQAKRNVAPVEGIEQKKPVSMELLRHKQNYYRERMHFQGGSKYRDRLEAVTEQLKALELRFSGPDAAYQRRAYLEELQIVCDSIRTKRMTAQQQNDQAAISQYNEELQIVKREIRNFQSSARSQDETGYPETSKTTSDSERQPTSGAQAQRNVAPVEEVGQRKKPVSMELLRCKQTYYRERMYGQDGSRYKDRLEAVTKQLKELERRFSGPDAAYQRRVYLEELHAVCDRIRAKRTMAQQQEDEAAIAQCNKELNIVKQEIRSFQNETGHHEVSNTRNNMAREQIQSSNRASHNKDDQRNQNNYGGIKIVRATE